MKIVAVLACRNEAAFLPTCLHHLVMNGSTDGSLDIIHSAEFRSHLAGLKRVPYPGRFELEPLLRAKMALADEVEADWAMNVCPDEILHANREGGTLLKEISFFDKQGFNAVNFDEFVFLPVVEPWIEGWKGWPAQRHYYFFEPKRLRQMRAWKKGMGFSMVPHGGHHFQGACGLRLAPESLVLRHYLFRNQDHAYEKFTSRRFAEDELARGWHRNRHGFSRESYTLPPPERLETLDKPESFSLSRARPWSKHYWQN